MSASRPKKFDHMSGNIIKQNLKALIEEHL